jgi:hypothetical protein
MMGSGRQLGKFARQQKYASPSKMQPGPVVTAAEKQLFIDVLKGFKGTLDWKQVTAAYNRVVLERMENKQGALYSFKSEAYLRQYSNQCGGELAEQRCKAIADALQKERELHEQVVGTTQQQPQVQHAGGSGQQQQPPARQSGAAVQVHGGATNAGGSGGAGTSAAASTGAAVAAGQAAGAGSQARQQNVHPLMRAASRQSSQPSLLAGQAQGSGKGGRNTKKRCKFCLLKTGKEVLKAGHTCPNKKVKLSKEAENYVRALAEGRAEWDADTSKAMWEQKATS